MYCSILVDRLKILRKFNFVLFKKINFLLLWVFVAVRGLSLVAASGG